MRSIRRALRELERNDLANKGEPPINLVPMIDILTVLVLYLLVGTIFKQFTILQLNLPGPAASAVTEQKPALDLKVTLRKDRLEMSTARGGTQALANLPTGYNLTALAELLAQIKRRNADEDSVTLLLEPDINYDALVQVMDTARVFPAGTEEAERGLPMFPAIAIGDAPGAARRRS
jgi:biopolymer transport protein ExbD